MPFRIAIERPLPPPATHLIEVTTPRTNAAVITAAENLLANLSLHEPFALEIAADRVGRRFFLRAGSTVMAGHLRSLLRAPYPQARLEARDPLADPACDPARRERGERRAARALVLGAPDYLALRLFRDADIDAGRADGADPVLGILGALDDLPRGWRALAQLVLASAPKGWGQGYTRLALEQPLAGERTAGERESFAGPLLLAGAVAAVALGWQAWQWWATRDWSHLALLVAVALAIPAVAVLARRLLGARAVYDPALVREKIARPVFAAQLRLAVFAPPGTPLPAVEARLDRLVAAYGQFAHHAGNRLVPCPLRLAPDPPVGGAPLSQELRGLAFLLPACAKMVLNTREAAGLWHLPQAGSDVALLPRTGARRRLPLPHTVASGCRVGIANDRQGTIIPVALADDLLRRHLLLVGKTGRGKSSLMLGVIRYLAAPRFDLAVRPGVDGAKAQVPRPAVVLVDPHRDLARAALALVPPSRRDDVIFLDLANRAQPFGLNPLDTGLGWERDGAVENTLLIFRRQFSEYWGPRMEDAFRYGLRTLYAANEDLVAADPRGSHAARGEQYTLLDLPALFHDLAFRKALLARLADSVIREWWDQYIRSLDWKWQQEIFNPVLTKIHRYAGSWAAAGVVGQPRSTVDPRDWLRAGRILIVDGGPGTIGEDTTALICGALLNALKLAVAAQATRPPEERAQVTIIVDEFHAIPGADYEAILAELRKFGGSLVLATQSLEQLDALDHGGKRALRASVFAGNDGLFAFNVSSADARALVPELGGEAQVAVEDLVALDDFECYAKLSCAGTRQPAFLLTLPPPLAWDQARADALAAEAGRRWGRDRARVEADRAAARARIALTHRTAQGGGSGAGGATHVPAAGEDGARKTGRKSKGRKHGRSQRDGAPPAEQPPLWEPEQPDRDGETGAGQG